MLPVVKAYPVLDQVSHSEAVCVAGISFDEPHRWIRLFPLDFRGLQRAQQFKKYQVIQLDASRSSKDSRPESYAPVLDSIELGETISSESGSWKRRLPYFDAVGDESMCEIQRQQKAERKSLGVFRPEEVSDLAVSEVEPDFVARQHAVLDQMSLTGDRAGDESRKQLEPLPIKAKFKYRCSDAKCPGHDQSLIDWELGALYRTLRNGGDTQQSIHRKIREKFLDEYCGDTVDTRFITGSMLRHPGSFLILGLVHSKRKPVPQDESLF